MFIYLYQKTRQKYWVRKQFNHSVDEKVKRWLWISCTRFMLGLCWSQFSWKRWENLEHHGTAGSTEGHISLHPNYIGDSYGITVHYLCFEVSFAISSFFDQVWWRFFFFMVHNSPLFTSEIAIMKWSSTPFSSNLCRFGGKINRLSLTKYSSHHH